MKVNLKNLVYTDTLETIVEAGPFKVTAFRYSTGVAALKVANDRGSFVILPKMGQMIWRCEFDGLDLTMRSIYDEPKACQRCFDESYGCFLMHCGLSAMGNPTAEDSHPGHGELPIIAYDEPYLEVNENFVAVSGVAKYDKCFTWNYEFRPRVELRKGEARLHITAEITNLKDIPLEYYYLCHINYLPINGSKIVESPLARKPIINHEVPGDYYSPWAKATNAWLAALDKDYRRQNTIGAKDESYRPEIVNCYFHQPDAKGWAEVRQVFPKKLGKVRGVYVAYRPEELPYATRWIARTKDEDALGMCLPATAEHKGLAYCRRNGQQRYLQSGERIIFHLEAGLI